MIGSERPGVYTSYEVSGVLYSGGTARTVGVCAAAEPGADKKIHTVTSYSAAVSLFGAESNLSELIRILILNGAGVIKAVPLEAGEGEASAQEYEAAFSLLASELDVKIIVCDSRDTAVFGLLRDSVEISDRNSGYKIGIAEFDGSVEAAVSAAEDINCERVVLAYAKSAHEGAPGGLAAAVAGAVASAGDPAIPLNGERLYGTSGIESMFTDADITALIEGGVTPIEAPRGYAEIVRGITTRTSDGGVKIATWRELTTVLIIDDVIPAIRDKLRAMFTRTKNTVQTRGAIRTQVIIELEQKLEAEIIDGYENVEVRQSEADPTVCEVGFEFTVAHGLNQIRLKAYITV